MSNKCEYLPTRYWVGKDGTINRAFYEYEQDFIDSPREWSNTGIIVNASRYCITGDDDIQTKDIEEWLLSETGINEDWYNSNYRRYGGIDGLLNKFIKEKCLVFEFLNVYEHSGVTISCGRSNGWDNSNVGFIYIPKDSTEVKDYRKNHSKEETKEWAEEVLHMEVKTLADYLEGNVYCLVHEVYDEETKEWNMEDTLGDVYLTSKTYEEEEKMAEREIVSQYSGDCAFLSEDKIKDTENGNVDTLKGQLLLDFSVA